MTSPAVQQSSAGIAIWPVYFLFPDCCQCISTLKCVHGFSGIWSTAAADIWYRPPSSSQAILQCRSIVFQSRQSVAVQHPEQLADHLQILTGSHAFQLRLTDVRECIKQLESQLLSLSDEQTRCQLANGLCCLAFSLHGNEQAQQLLQ